MTHLRLPFAGPSLYRVARAGWPDPLDTSFSRGAADNRWNTADFGALYTCGSLLVARAVARDVLGLAAVDPDDLQPAWRPCLVEVGWAGEVVDAATPGGLAALGFPAADPADVPKRLTREAAERWHRDGENGVACRSASLSRFGFADWTGTFTRWSELALFVENCRTRPVLLGRRDDLDWLTPGEIASPYSRR